MKYYYTYGSPVGQIRITEDKGFITHIIFKNSIKEERPLFEKETYIIKETYSQLSEYFEGKRKNFKVPLKPNGTEFQKKVWAILSTIPYGETWTYKKVAEVIECHNGYRAVGLANNQNPIAIIIPCHRVIGASTSLTGYAGGLDIKKFLINLERNNSVRNGELF